MLASSQAAPYEAMFRSLRVSTDYSIKISFIMDGHTLGVVDFTIAAEERYLHTMHSSLKLKISKGDSPRRPHRQDLSHGKCR